MPSPDASISSAAILRRRGGDYATNNIRRRHLMHLCALHVATDGVRIQRYNGTVATANGRAGGAVAPVTLNDASSLLASATGRAAAGSAGAATHAFSAAADCIAGDCRAGLGAVPITSGGGARFFFLRNGTRHATCRPKPAMQRNLRTGVAPSKRTQRVSRGGLRSARLPACAACVARVAMLSAAHLVTDTQHSNQRAHAATQHGSSREGGFRARSAYSCGDDGGVAGSTARAF
jgi:hypothetical protein